MACGYAMYTDRLGVCFATAGPGAFNLFSGLAVAMSDSYPVLAISGYASLDWQGRGSLNETSGINRTPDSRAMFAPPPRSPTCSPTSPTRATCLRRRSTSRSRDAPARCTSTCRRISPSTASSNNYRDIRLDVAPVRPDPGRVEEIAAVLASAIDRGEPIVALAGFGAIRSGAGEQVMRLIERFQIPLLTTLDGKGIVPEGHPLCVGVFGDSGHASARKAFREAKVVLCIGNALNQHATFDYHDGLFDGKVHIRINISETEITKVYKPDYALALGCPGGGRGPLGRRARGEGRRGGGRARQRGRTTKPGTSWM